jgi:carboxyl-terminal processing protease
MARSLEKIEKKDQKLPANKMDEQFKSDYQILRALDLLKGWEILKSMQKTG